MARANVGEVGIGYDVHGDGEPLLLVMGLGYGRWGWNWQIPALSERFRVVSYDNRGIGESDAPPGPYTVAQMAKDAVGLLDELGIERAHVVGCSLGGMISQEIALSYPERVDRLVLACTCLHATEPYPLPDERIWLLRQSSDLPREQLMRLFVENALSKAFAAARPEVVEAIVALRLATAQTAEAWQAQSEAGAAFDSRARAGAIAAPTLVLVGDEDNVLDVRHSRLVAEAVPGARYEQMPGGHLFFLEQAARFNAAVAGFLAG